MVTRKSSAAHSTPNVEVIDPSTDIILRNLDTQVLGWTVEKVDGADVVKVTPEFIKDVQTRAGAIGTHMLSAEARAIALTDYALNMNNLFKAFKDSGGTEYGKGLPAFVKCYFVPELPGKFGDAGTPMRKQVQGNPVFAGIDALIKRANKELKTAANRKELAENNVNPDAPKEVKEFQKKNREKDEASEIQDFVDTMTAIVNEGLTPDNIERLVGINMGLSNAELKLTAKGKLFYDAGSKAVLKANAAKKSA